MRYEQFWPGDKVIVIVDYQGTPSGTVGTVASRFMGNTYLVRLPNDDFWWLSDRSISSTDPITHRLKAGDLGVIISKNYQDFAQMGEELQVVKVAHDVDYYGIPIDNKIKWFSGFQLAKHL